MVGVSDQISTQRQAAGVSRLVDLLTVGRGGQQAMNESQERPFCIFDSHVKASDAIQPLARAGFDVIKLSLVGMVAGAA